MFLSDKILPATRLAIMSLALGILAAGAVVADEAEIERECMNQLGINKTLQELANDIDMHREQLPLDEQATSNAGYLREKLGDCIRNETIIRASDPLQPQLSEPPEPTESQEAKVHDIVEELKREGDY